MKSYTSTLQPHKPKGKLESNREIFQNVVVGKENSPVAINGNTLNINNIIMANRIKWELMKPDAIEIRPAQVKDGKVTLLAYQNGRNTMDALDKQFGEFGWKVEYKDVAGQIYGRLSVKDPETGEWIYKEDTGEESNISASKGQSTDILKRLAVRFGYGRELYSIPKIVIPDDGYGNHVKVSEVIWNDKRECIHITLVNKFGKVMYRWDKDDEEECKPVPNESRIQMTNQRKKLNSQILRDFCSEKKNEEGVDVDDLLRFYKFYLPKVEEGWKGEFKVDRLWSSWAEKRRVA